MGMSAMVRGVSCGSGWEGEWGTDEGEAEGVMFPVVADDVDGAVEDGDEVVCWGAGEALLKRLPAHIAQDVVVGVT